MCMLARFEAACLSTAPQLEHNMKFIQHSRMCHRSPKTQAAQASSYNIQNKMSKEVDAVNGLPVPHPACLCVTGPFLQEVIGLQWSWVHAALHSIPKRHPAKFGSAFFASSLN